MNSSSATIDELSLALSFVLDGPKTTDQSRHDSMYQDGVFSYVWFEAKAFPVILLGSEASVHSDMGAINNAVVCRNSHPMCCMRCCMIFSSAVSARSPFSHRKVNTRNRKLRHCSPGVIRHKVLGQLYCVNISEKRVVETGCTGRGWCTTNIFVRMKLGFS